MRHRFSLPGLLALMLLLSLATVLPAMADCVVFQFGNHPQTNEENILFNINQTGSTINGITNQSNTLIGFSSLTDTLIATASGQAKAEAQDGLINQITIFVPGGSFTDVILNPFNLGTPTDLSIFFDCGANGSQTFDFIGGPGNNFFTAVATVPNSLLSVTITSQAGFNSLLQPRISFGQGTEGNPVPEPSSLLALGSGLVGAMGYVARRRRSAG